MAFNVRKIQRCWVKEAVSYSFTYIAFNQIYWVTGSLIGSLIGTLIPFSIKGIDFAMTALFVTVFVDQWVKTDDHKPALIGVICSVICLIIFGKENFLIPSMIAVIGVLSLVCLPSKKEADNG